MTDKWSKESWANDALKNRPDIKINNIRRVNFCRVKGSVIGALKIQNKPFCSTSALLPIFFLYEKNWKNARPFHRRHILFQTGVLTLCR